MINRTLCSLLLLIAMTVPCLAQESPTSRFSSYLKTMERAKTLSEIRPFFSAGTWAELYGDVADGSPELQAEILSTTSEMFKGWIVKSEVIEDGKATLSVADDKGEISPILMIQENGSWVIDG